MYNTRHLAHAMLGIAELNHAGSLFSLDPREDRTTRASADFGLA